MCEFLSFIISKDGKKIACGDLRSHSGSHEVLKTKADEWREAEWVKEGDAGLTVRVLPGEDTNFYRAIILAEYKTRAAAITAMIGKVDAAGGEINVSGEELESLILTNARTVYASGCTKLTKLDVPKGEYVDARGCTKLTKLDVPNARTVYARGCTKLTKLDVPNARTVYASGCTKLTKLDVPKGEYVDARGCTKLTKKV
jgi:uncharacterized protein YceK